VNIFGPRESVSNEFQNLEGFQILENTLTGLSPLVSSPELLLTAPTGSRAYARPPLTQSPAGDRPLLPGALSTGRRRSPPPHVTQAALSSLCVDRREVPLAFHFFLTSPPLHSPSSPSCWSPLPARVRLSPSCRDLIYGSNHRPSTQR
jgi:hypothetical protein